MKYLKNRKELKNKLVKKNTDGSKRIELNDFVNKKSGDLHVRLPIKCFRQE